MIEEGNTVEGLKALDRLAPTIPEDPRVSWSLGQAYFMRREYELSTKAFQNAVRLRPADRQSWNMLGQSLMNQGDYESALIALDRVLEIDPVNEWASFFKARALQELKRNTEAGQYSAAYEKYGEDYYARNRQWRHREKNPIDNREAYAFHWHTLRYIIN